MKLLILYEELAGYFMACVEHLSSKYGIEVHIIRKRTNSDAPFELKASSKITIHEREGRDLEALVRVIGPDAVFCGGWSYEPYLKICRGFKKKIPVFVGFDNTWTGSLKQRVKVMLGKKIIKRCFDKCFVPGPSQKIFAEKLGFKERDIVSGAYCCDTDYFHELYLRNEKAKALDFPKKFIFLGRYAPEKNADLLWNVFSGIPADQRKAWELLSLGKGPLSPLEHPAIRHAGFVQPRDLPEFISQSGVFVLPSSFEPWGVAVHEFACAGFPMILSDQVHAGEIFLNNGENGFKVKSNSKEELRSALKKIMELDTEELGRMGRKSAELGMKINLDTWANSVYNLMNNK
jgi:glycosyltransferase involved in cell wall biosynthesis